MNFTNSLIGVALGDAVGLPYEGLSRQKIAKFSPNFNQINLVFGKGMFSDDTEHSVIVANSLIDAKGNPKLFQKLLKRRLRVWLLTLPAGVGFATMRAIIKSFIFKNSGVFSAGNAPAMRSHLIGLAYGDNNSLLEKFVRVNTVITHTDPKAYYGALSVAKATYLSANGREDEFLDEIKKLIKDEEFIELIENIFDNLDITTLEFAKKIGLEKGVSGYIYHSLPIALHSWFKNRDSYRQAIIDVVLCGGDTDTTGAIVGGIVGAKTKTFPKEWVDNIIDYPIDIKLLKKLNLDREKSIFINPLFSFIRNILFLGVVLIHGVRRIF